MKTKNKVSTKVKIIAAVVYIFLSVLNFIRIDANSHSASDTIRPFLFQCVALALIFFIISLLFRGENTDLK